TGGRRHVDRRVIVLDDDRDAVQRPADAAGATLGVEGTGLFERLWIERDHRVEARPFVVVRLDAGEVLLDEVVRRHRTDPLRGEQLEDRLLADVEGGRGRGRRQRRDQADLRRLRGNERGGHEKG